MHHFECWTKFIMCACIHDIISIYQSSNLIHKIWGYVKTIEITGLDDKWRPISGATKRDDAVQELSNDLFQLGNPFRPSRGKVHLKGGVVTRYLKFNFLANFPARLAKQTTQLSDLGEHPCRVTDCGIQWKAKADNIKGNILTGWLGG